MKETTVHVYYSKDSTVPNLALLNYKFGQKVNHKIILEITEMIDSSQGYLKTYKLIKAFFLFSFNIVNTSFYTIFKNGLWIDAIKVKNIYICDSSS